MKLTLTDQHNHQVVIELNNSSAARDLPGKTPAQVQLKNYSDDEKIFYPDDQLDLSDTPSANAVIGTLGYFAPFGDVCLFYGDFGSYSGLYELGQTVSGADQINQLSGQATVKFSD